MAVYRGYCVVWNELLGTKTELRPNSRFGIPPFGAIICHESSFVSREVYNKVGLYKVNYKYMMDLDLFIRIHKDKSIESKFMDICVVTFRTGGVSLSAASKVESERILMIRENGGSLFDALVYIFYHRCKYAIKVFVNTLKAWKRK